MLFYILLVLGALPLLSGVGKALQTAGREERIRRYGSPDPVHSGAGGEGAAGGHGCG
jgi:hypothetical protein